MTRAHRYSNIVGVVVPFLAFIVAIVLLWNSLFDLSDAIVFAIMYLICGLGVTLGFHRMLTHRSFQTYKPVEYAIAIAGSMAVEGPVLSWVADHRKHHAHTDKEGDPHSPHLQEGDTWKDAFRGLYHAHMGWLFMNQGQARYERYCRDLYEDAGMRRINRMFGTWIGLSLLMPAALGFLIGGDWQHALTGMLWGGFVRIFMLHHVTWSVNSLGHFLGYRRFDVEDHSTNFAWLAIPSLGETWHHNHHAFPRSHAHGLRWYEFDITALVIRGMKKVHLAWNVVEISRERQAQKEIGTKVAA